MIVQPPPISKAEPQLSKAHVLALILCGLLLFQSAVTSGEIKSDRGLLSIVWLKTPQGRSLFITSPGGRQILIDGGSSSIITQLGAAVPFYDRTLDILISTRPDSEYLTGLIEVVQKYKIGHVMETDTGCLEPVCRQWYRTLAQEKVFDSAIEHNETIDLGDGLVLTFQKNDDSVSAIDLRFGNQTASVISGNAWAGGAAGPRQHLDFIFTDQRTLRDPSVKNYLIRHPPVSLFLDNTDQNRFGLFIDPSLAWLAQEGISYYSTDVDGMMELLMDGQNYLVRKI